MSHAMIKQLSEAHGRYNALQRVKAYREQHGCTLNEALAALVAQLGSTPPITEEQVKTAIAVLQTYAKHVPNIAPALLDDLDAAIEAAYNGIICDIHIGPDITPPLTSSW